MEQPDIAFWAQLIANTGFPMALTIYLLTNFRRTLDELKSDFKTFIHEISLAIKENKKG